MGKNKLDANPELIFVADDDPRDQALIRCAFDKAHFGKQLAMTANDQSALDYLRQQQARRALPDMMVLGLDMPGEESYRVLHTMTNDPALRKIPVVVFSNSAQQKDIRYSYRQGAWLYVIKPASTREYESIVHTMKNFWQRHCCLPQTPLNACTEILA